MLPNLGQNNNPSYFRSLTPRTSYYIWASSSLHWNISRSTLQR